MSNNICTPLSSMNYNNISTIEEQHHHVDPSTLQALAELFRDYNVDHYFGICLLHRHHSLPAGYIMVHSRDYPGVDTCSMERLGYRPQYACAYYLERDALYPYEFCSTPRATPDTDFTKAVSSFLQTKSLERILGLCCITPLEQSWIEVPQDCRNVLISRQVSTVTDLTTVDGVVTEWAFVREKDAIKIKEHKKCIRPEGGGHKKVADASAVR